MDRLGMVSLGMARCCSEWRGFSVIGTAWQAWKGEFWFSMVLLGEVVRCGMWLGTAGSERRVLAV